MKKISEYDERQLNLMLNQLDAYDNKKLDLGSLVGRLEGLLHTIEHVTAEWEEKFLDEFSTLESINAEVPKLNQEEIEKLIKNSVCNLKNLVQEKLHS